MSAAATMVSPSFPFPGPPPPPSPYGHTTAGSASNPSAQNGLISPPESRRTSGDEPLSAPTTRQSLPSISEALGGADPALPYPPQVPPPVHSTSSYFQTPASTSVTDLHRRSVTSGPAPPEPPHSYPPSHPQSPYMNRGRHPAQAPHTPTGQGDPYSRAPYSGQPPKLPTLHPIKTDSSPTAASFRPSVTYASQHPSPAYDTPPHTAPSQAPYPYSGQQSQGYQYSQPPPASSGPGPLYPPSGPPPAPPRPYGESGRWENGQADDRARLSVGFHGDSVKRHLDDFDLEASLNEVAECSGKMLEFTREYGVRTHNNQRAGINPRSVPHLQTVEELITKNRRVDESLKRIREMVIAQNHALEQQMKDRGQVGPGSYSDVHGYADDKQGMGGFAGNDTKKRRGRAAPPGRCHSCNRAETPEWRRGPDGARTLCNACGLHYAKLTRKMGNKSQIPSSNLRPKSEA